MYTIVIVNGQEYVDATQQNENKIDPEWTTFAFVSSATKLINISISLYEEEIGDNDEYDINPASTMKNLVFTYEIDTENITTGTIVGVFNSEQTAITTEGDDSKDSAKIKFYVATRTIGSCGSTMASAPVTPLDCRNPSPAVCSEGNLVGEEDSNNSSSTQSSLVLLFIVACIYALF